ncbi:speckle-type POZ protein-like [Microplitis mediator]|uniref:speckle-type POZ protein-like n=1 Tax=Microplitis mediator TaxID=375433 RepID=UPI0025554DD4|nr:speckle-type POZ protein-like [Microplitis mediator]XP_057323580.1 speckle-type POZ protein-like [Microplitis mediator]
MPLQTRFENFYITRKTWEIRDINKLLERADRNGHEDPVTLEKDFSKVFRYSTHLIEWKVELKISSSKLFPGGLSLSLIPVSGMNCDTCNFYLVDIDKNNLYIGPSDQSTYTNREDPDFVPDRFQRKKEDLLPNNTMTLLVEVFSYWECYPMIPHSKILSTKGPIEVPIDYFELYNSREDSGDVVVIQVQNTKFPVHKNVLEKGCPLLYEEVVRHQQTFDSSNNSKLTLTGIEPEIFKKVVEYIYTDKVCNLDDHLEYLLEAADKYELIKLKKMCEKTLVWKYLTIRHAPRIYDLAIRCHSPKLRQSALTFRPDIEKPSAPWPMSLLTVASSEYEYETTNTE